MFRLMPKGRPHAGTARKLMRPFSSKKTGEQCDQLCVAPRSDAVAID
jgi:hypothetical protein